MHTGTTTIRSQVLALASRIRVDTIDGALALTLQTLVIYYFSLALVVAYVWRIGIFPYDFFGYWHSLTGIVLNATFVAWLTLSSLFFFYPMFWYTARHLSDGNYPEKRFLRVWLIIGVPFWTYVIGIRLWHQQWLGEYKADFYMLLAAAWAAFIALYVYGSPKHRKIGSLTAIFLFLPFYLSDVDASTYAVEKLLSRVGLGGRLHVQLVPHDSIGKSDTLQGTLLLLGPEHAYIEQRGITIVVPRANTRRIEVMPEDGGLPSEPRLLER